MEVKLKDYLNSNIMSAYETLNELNKRKNITTIPKEVEQIDNTILLTESMLHVLKDIDFICKSRNRY